MSTHVVVNHWDIFFSHFGPFSRPSYFMCLLNLSGWGKSIQLNFPIFNLRWIHWFDMAYSNIELMIHRRIYINVSTHLLFSDHITSFTLRNWWVPFLFRLVPSYFFELDHLFLFDNVVAFNIDSFLINRLPFFILSCLPTARFFSNLYLLFIFII